MKDGFGDHTRLRIKVARPRDKGRKGQSARGSAGRVLTAAQREALAAHQIKLRQVDEVPGSRCYCTQALWFKLVVTLQKVKRGLRQPEAASGLCPHSSCSRSSCSPFPLILSGPLFSLSRARAGQHSTPFTMPLHAVRYALHRVSYSLLPVSYSRQHSRSFKLN